MLSDMPKWKSRILNLFTQFVVVNATVNSPLVAECFNDVQNHNQIVAMFVLPKTGINQMVNKYSIYLSNVVYLNLLEKK